MNKDALLFCLNRINAEVSNFLTFLSSTPCGVYFIAESTAYTYV